MNIPEALLVQNVTVNGDVAADCEGSKFHTPTPLLAHRVDLAAYQPASKTPDPVWLCAVCRDNLDVFVRLMIASTGTLPWDTKRQFGNKIRALGTRVWQTYFEENRA